MLVAYCVSETIKLEAMVEIKDDKNPTELRRFLSELSKTHGTDSLDVLKQGSYRFTNSMTGYSFKVICVFGKKTNI